MEKNNFIRACEPGDINYLEKNISNNYQKNSTVFGYYYGPPVNNFSIERGFIIACEKDDINIVAFIYKNYKIYHYSRTHFLDFNSINFYRGLDCACQKGNLNIVKLLFQYGFEVDKFLTDACYSNNLKLLKFLIKKGANNFNEGFKTACHFGNMPLILFLISKGANNLNDGLEKASRLSSINLMKFLINLGADDFNKALHGACYEDNLNIIDFLIKCGANNLREAFNVAIYCGNLTLIKYFVNLGLNLKKKLMYLLIDRYDNKTSIKNIEKIDYDIPLNLNNTQLFKWLLDKNLFNLEKLFIKAYNNSKEYYCIYLIEKGVIINNKKLLNNDNLKHLLVLCGIVD
jgi:hypothetical protein